ncbi:type III-A CRISPR-associated protein Cas10/Csm1 [Chloroflexus sp.]|uniref:type III-A CRISPR-associated protein Cas10/Csm1 n=1 Tax=Chloroflexus sp. TaxID=1904827 RepID=UPI00298F3A3A|nr:type III-A CRISPR-associated protein Cas10/Csm1 [Chloroflexus sp.]MDW8405928.1 type III-A CRISPR-associated protein Cas10/Csm1 [Chloroflexus sp.]
MTISNPTAVAAQVLQAWVTAALGETPPAELAATARQIAGLATAPGWPPFPLHLPTIFTRLAQGAPAQAWQPPAVLQCREAVLFPVEHPVAVGNDLRQALRAGAQQAGQATDAATRLERLLNVLQRYAWAWPSPLDAVSLYDLARLHAAVSAAQAADPRGQICLLGGDVSGLQDFLYSIPAEGAARQLRGRSLYLQLLTDACAQWVLRESQMPLCNLLYAGGGRFYVVLPGQLAEADKVLAWRRQLGRVLLRHHRGALYLALGATQPFAPDQYSEQTWLELTAAIDSDKRRRFAALDEGEFAQLFEPRPIRPPRSDSPDEPDPLGESLAELGRRLTRAAVLLVDTNAQPVGGATWRSAVSELGVNYELAEQVRLPVSHRRALALDDEAVPSDGAQALMIGQRYLVTEAYRLSEQDWSRYRQIDPAQAGELRAGDVAPFNLLAHLSIGVPRIAVLRMDVDNLGDLFGRGLDRPSGIAGLAVTAALSSALSRFFEGWVGELCRRFNQTGNGGIYAVYSGGDDLFLVGSWHLIPELAMAIRADFTRYTGGAVTVSAGITLHHAGYPLYQAADDAGAALDAAKAYERTDGRRKDAITFLGQTLSWAEFSHAAQLKDELIDLIEQGAPRSLLMAIQRMALRARQRYNRAGEAQVIVGPWVWQGEYQLTRLAERSGTLRARIEALRDRLLSAEAVGQGAIFPAGLAARWAQLLLRGGAERNEPGTHVP